MSTELAELMLTRFAGRANTVAVGRAGKFAPEASSITAQRLANDHLAQRTCLGFYLLDEASRVRCSCVDFDNHEGESPEWRTQAETLYYLLNSLDVPALVELSQSGEGCHVWIFFDQPTDAWVPRAFWRAAASKIDAKFREVYPRQDVLDGKGYGNLVRYPLWNLSRFVDVENDWRVIDAADALRDVRTTSLTDLRTVAFQSGLGNLEPDGRVAFSHIEGMSDVLPTRVAKLLSNGSSLLVRRWNNDTIGMGADKSRSTVAMSLCCEMVRSYVPTPEIGSTLRAWCAKHSYQEKGDRDDWINRTVAKAYDYVVQRREKSSTSVSTLRDAAHAFIDTIEQGIDVKIASGISDLDNLIGGGVSPGEVAIVAGRPSHGKSALGFQWAGFASSVGVKSLIISEEMGKLQIGKRRCMTICGVPSSEWVQASAASMRRDIDEYHKGHADAYVVESCGTVDRTGEVIDQFCELHGVGLVMIDYLQLLGTRANAERYEVVTEASRAIKQAAVRNNVPILLLCQLNRGIEGRDDHAPKLSDLRESGQIEQDADQVFFCVYPSRFTDAPPDLYHIYCGKNRNGPGAGERVETSFNPHKQIIGFDGLPDVLKDL